jgi:hypothetical protein
MTIDPGLFEINGSSPLKRKRRTKNQMAALRQALWNIVAEMRPMTVRQVCYQASARGLIGKTDKDFDDAADQLTIMRHAWIKRQNPDDDEEFDDVGMDEDDLAMPLDWIIDQGRRVREVSQWENITGVMTSAADGYRKNIWTDEADYVEIWVEKDTLLTIVQPITNKYGVRLMSAKGFSSLSLLYEVSQYLKGLDKNIHIYQFGDFDPSGFLASKNIETTLEKLGVENFKFTRPPCLQAAHH